MTWTAGSRYQLSPSTSSYACHVLVGSTTSTGAVAEPARAEDERRVVGVNAPAQAGDVGPARPVRAEADVYEPASASRRATHLLRRGHRLAERVPVPAGGGRRARRARGAGLEDLERDAVRAAPADVQHGDLAGRVAARLEAGEQRRGAGPAGAEHEPEDDCDGSDHRRRRRRGSRRDGGGTARCSWRHRRRRRQPRSNGLLTAVRKRHPQGATTFARWSNSPSSVRSRLSKTESRSRSAARSSGRCSRCCCSRRARVVSLDRLVEALWEDNPPATATASLQNFVAQLRKALGPDAIETRPPGYLVRLEPEQLDVARVRSLVDAARASEPVRRAALLDDALALWRGEPLAEFRYEAFAREEIARLEEFHLTLVEERAEAKLAIGEHAELVERARGARPRAPAARAAARPADARALPLRPAGAGARGLPRGPRAARRGARASSRARSCAACTPRSSARRRSRSTAARSPRSSTSRRWPRRCSPARSRSWSAPTRSRSPRSSRAASASTRTRRSSRASRRPSPCSTARARCTTRSTRSSRETASRRPSTASSRGLPALLRERETAQPLLVTTGYELALERALEEARGAVRDGLLSRRRRDARQLLPHRAERRGERDRAAERVHGRARPRRAHGAPPPAGADRPVDRARLGELRRHRGRLHPLRRRRPAAARVARGAPAPHPSAAARLHALDLDAARRARAVLGQRAAAVPLLVGAPRAAAARAGVLAAPRRRGRRHGARGVRRRARAGAGEGGGS